LSGAELETLERTGCHSGRADLTGLAGVIGLDARKLSDIANGWTPAAKPIAALPIPVNY
jgi:hypothetical protein